MRLVACALLALAACGNNGEAAPKGNTKVSGDIKARVPEVKLAPVAKDAMCATRGALAIGGEVTEPTVRGYVRGSGGDAAAMKFTFRGDTAKTRDLAGGQTRRQIGLKLRAQDGCNLVYVMWRLDPKLALDVSVKINAGKKTHEQCGADGYTKVKPIKAVKNMQVPALVAGESHTMRAEIVGDELHVWIDDKPLWRGTLPASARTLKGPAGLRSDNLSFVLDSFEAPGGDPNAPLPKCAAGESD
jgi:hypothetical protein